MARFDALVRRAGSYSAREIMADRTIHTIGLLAAVAAIAVLMTLVARQHDLDRLLTICVYAAGLAAMLGCSAAYNLARASPRKETLRRFDHAAIFVMIAGTYTPFSVDAIGGARGWVLLSAVWVMAMGGVAMKLLLPLRFEVLSVALYLLIGWVGLVALEPLVAALPLSSFALLAGGGVLYTVGVAFYAIAALPFHKAIWHGMVLAAAACHYGAVLSGIVLVS